MPEDLLLVGIPCPRAKFQRFQYSCQFFYEMCRIPTSTLIQFERIKNTQKQLPEPVNVAIDLQFIAGEPALVGQCFESKAGVDFSEDLLEGGEMGHGFLGVVRGGQIRPTWGLRRQGKITNTPFVSCL